MLDWDLDMTLANLRITPVSEAFSAEDACDIATEFLLDNVGNQLVVSQPLRMISAVRSTWIVPVQLAYVHTGVLGNVGVIAVDEETGQVVGWTPIEQIKDASRTLRKQNEPEFSERFQSAMTSSD